MIAIPSSYKDPAGFLFLHEQEIYRAVNKVYLPRYQLCMQSGLYQHLQQKGLLIAHEEIDHLPCKNEVAKVLKPIQLPLISYACEWSFSMLRDAALCTLNNALEAMAFGMHLKDANTFNIQFYQGKPLLIDTLSFDFYRQEESWIAYRQFCECFVAPLVLMKYCNLSLNKLLIAYPNGIPLSVCRSMLPVKARWNMHVYLHIFLQSKVSAKPRTDSRSSQVFSKQKMLNLLNGLHAFISKLQPGEDKTTWDNYYQETILSEDYLQEKKSVVEDFLDRIPCDSLIDLGANEGAFSLIAAQKAKHVIALDEDRHCIEKLYLFCKKNNIRNIDPLIVDLTAPTPAVGWHNTERSNIFDRVKADVTLALALIHHLAIAHNVRFDQIITLLYELSEYVLVEFIDKSDPKVQQLLASREDIFPEYTLVHFKQLLQEKFDILAEHNFKQSSRTLLLVKRKND